MVQQHPDGSDSLIFDRSSGNGGPELVVALDLDGLKWKRSGGPHAPLPPVIKALHGLSANRVRTLLVTSSKPTEDLGEYARATGSLLFGPEGRHELPGSPWPAGANDHGVRPARYVAPYIALNAPIAGAFVASYPNTITSVVVLPTSPCKELEQAAESARTDRLSVKVVNGLKCPEDVIGVLETMREAARDNRGAEQILEAADAAVAAMAQPRTKIGLAGLVRGLVPSLG